MASNMGLLTNSYFTPDANLEKFYIKSLLNQHRDKNFVQRILEPDKWGVIEGAQGQPGDSYSTHVMSYATNDKGAFVYPEVVYDPDAGKLKQLSRDEAKKYALKTGEYLPFDSEDAAKWFAENYKKIW